MPTLLKRLTDPILAGLTVLGGMVSLLTLYPRVTVSTSFETKDPLSSSFLVSNDGYLPVYSVMVYCRLGIVGIGNFPQSGEQTDRFGSGIQPAFIPVTTLVPGAKELVPFNDCIASKPGDHLTIAHVGLRITYRPLLWPWKRSFTQEFYAKDNGSGGYILYSVPYSE